MTTWMGPPREAGPKPLSSPWVMMMAPMIRVDMPQEVWWG